MKEFCTTIFPQPSLTKYICDKLQVPGKKESNKSGISNIALCTGETNLYRSGRTFSIWPVISLYSNGRLINFWLAWTFVRHLQRTPFIPLKAFCTSTAPSSRNSNLNISTPIYGPSNGRRNQTVQFNRAFRFNT